MTDECRTDSSGNKFRSVVTKHLKNVYESGELPEDATCANFAQVADNGKTYHYKFYSLSAIILFCL